MPLRPQNPKELAEALGALSGDRRTIRLGGNFSKDRLGGAPGRADEIVSTASMARILQYEPRDLTISVEAGLPWVQLEQTLAAQGQMVPLDPGWQDGSTAGGVVASNLSGPRRRGYGTARDMVIGMSFATLEGKLIQSGGMVVKNVAGLDMAKLMIGSFGTLAAIAIVNFKVFPILPHSRTFVLEFDSASEAFRKRDAILKSVLQPVAIDYVNTPAAAMLGLTRHSLLVRAAGNRAVADRWEREFAPAAWLTESGEAALWDAVRQFAPRFLRSHPEGRIVSLPAKLTEMNSVVDRLSAPVIARAGSGVLYVHCADRAPAVEIGGGFEMMKKVKALFDPHGLLNPGRLYGFL